jgi:hypothetical protein
MRLTQSKSSTMPFWVRSLWFILNLVLVLAALIVGVLLISILQRVVDSVSPSLGLAVTRRWEFPAFLVYCGLVALGLARLPASKPVRAHVVALLAFLVALYAYWPAWNLRYAPSDQSSVGAAITLFVTLLVVGGMVFRAIYEMFRRRSMAAIAFLACLVAIFASLVSDAYVKSGARIYLAVNASRFSPANCPSDRPVCVTDNNGRALFIQSGLDDNGRTMTEWYGFLYNTDGGWRTGLAYNMAGPEAGCALGGNWYLVQSWREDGPIC